MDTKNSGEKSIRERIEEGRRYLEAMNQRAQARDKHFDQLVEEGKQEYVAYRRGEDLPPKKEAAKPGIPGLKEHIAQTQRLLSRVQEIDREQERLLNEMAAIPLEQQCDEIYEEVGASLEALDREDLNEAESLDRNFNEDDRQFQEDEKLEKAGQPPPLRRG